MISDSIASYEVSDPTGKYVGKLEILTQLKSWKTADGSARRRAAEALAPGREPKAGGSVQPV